MHKIKFAKLPNLGALLRGHFFSGLLVVIPLGVIGWIASGLLSGLWEVKEIVPDRWQAENLFQDSNAALLFNIVVLFSVLLIFSLFVSFLGWSSKQYLGQKVLLWIGEMIHHIPVLRSIYSALEQLMKTMASGSGGQQFNRVVYVEYPRKGIWTLAFVTGPVKASQLGAGFLNIFVPTTPNPTSGFHLMVHESEVKESGLKVEEAFRTILSLGIVQSPANGGQ
jgi:uncharacterized membrane protein